ncbi:MAG: M12 family metallopeptidase [Saprospiraceae bacterium]|nr:M12 family metallopeptidase [Lewinella sp.]
MRSLNYLLLAFFLLLGNIPAHTQTARPIDGYAIDVGGEHTDYLYCIGTSKRLFKWNSRTQKWVLHSDAKRNLKRVTTWKHLPVVVDESGLVFLYRSGKFESLPGVFKEVSGNRQALYGLDITGRIYSWNSRESKWSKHFVVDAIANNIAAVDDQLFYTNKYNQLVRLTPGKGPLEKLNVEATELAGSSNGTLAIVDHKKEIRLFSTQTKAWKTVGTEPDFYRLTLAENAYFATGHNQKIYSGNIAGSSVGKVPALSDDGGEISQIKSAKNVLLPFYYDPMDIEYEVIDGETLFQGDIILGTASEVIAPKPRPHPKRLNPAIQYKPKSWPEGVGAQQQALVFTPNTDELWLHGIIPYRLDAEFSLDDRARILRGIEALNNETNLHIIPRAGEEDYVYIKKVEMRSAGGKSSLGRRGGEQSLKLNPGNFNEGTVIHELLHTAGFYHEQQRNDRDNFVQINFDNITLLNRHNFWKEDRDNAHTCGSYDVSSIMHYSGYAFSRNDEPTIIDRRTGLPVARTDELSDTDKDCVNLIYKVEGSEMVPPDVSRVREMKCTVKSLWTNTLESRVGDNKYPDFYADIEIGSGWRWTPGLDDTSTKQITTEVMQNAHDVRPNWVVNHFLEAGLEEAKVAITLKDEDGVRDRARYDIFDVNPRPGETTLELLVNTVTGEIYLGAPGGRTDLLIGYMGETLYVSGYDGDYYAQMGFEIGW